MQTIFGFLKAKGGEVKVEGESWTLNNTSRSLAGGMLYLSEERKHHGIFPLLSLRENIGISVLSLTSGKLGISDSRERNIVQKIIDDYGIRTSGMGKRISQLSGGNQQKAIIGRAMATRPRVLIFDEPTKGIDIRTKSEIYRIMKISLRRAWALSSSLRKSTNCRNARAGSSLCITAISPVSFQPPTPTMKHSWARSLEQR